MGKQKRSSTQWMLESLGDMEALSDKQLPPEFLCSLRGALEAGLSCEQLTAMLVLFVGIYEAGGTMSGEELVERANHIANVMKADICRCSLDRDRVRDNRALLAEKKRRQGA